MTDQGKSHAPKFKNSQPADKRKENTQVLQRRHFLRAGAAALSTAALAACGNEAATSKAGAPAVLRKKRVLTMVTSWPKDFPGLGTGAARVAKRITDLTDGQLTVQLSAAGELVGAFGVFDAVSRGLADMYHSAEYYFQGYSQAFNFFTGVPMGMTGPEMIAWIRHHGGQELWDKLSSDYNIKPFMAGSTGTQMGGWFKSELNTLDDLKGLRIRMPGMGGEVFRRLGATPVTLPGGEIFQSLDRGTIDATEWVGPWNDAQFGFQKVAKNYYYPGIHEPGTVLSLGLNKSLWEELSAQERAVIQAACDAENDVMLAEFNANNATSLRRLLEQDDINLARFPAQILKALVDTSADVMADAAKSDEMTSAVYTSYMESRRDSMNWGAVSERAFADARDQMAK